MKTVFLSLLLCAAFGPLFGQTPITWKTLEDVQYQTYKNIARNEWTSRAIFGARVKAVENKEVTITGYILPMDVGGGLYALSAFPYAACFFCGGGGKESVMELWQAKPRRFEIDERVTFKGILRTNQEEYGLSYVLENAVEVN